MKWLDKIMLSISPNNHSWQLILADLALILFLATAAALSASKGLGEDCAQIADNEADGTSTIAPAQALYRAGPGLPTLAEWLESQPPDPRASLTIVAQHAPGQEELAWVDARTMAATASAMGVRFRVIIREGPENGIHASLGYDQPTNEPSDAE